MINVESKEEREQASRWIDEAQSKLAILRAVLTGYERLQKAAEAATEENERLRRLVYENEQLRNRVETAERDFERLREEVGQLRAEAERSRKEREEIAKI
ncbi:MAG: hypothetical protein AAB285_01825, partial [candidate division NC10 bacterium]